MGKNMKNRQLRDQKNPRDAALLILLRVCEDHKKSHQTVREVLDACAEMDRRDRAFAKRVAEGSLEYQIRLDCILGRYLKKPLFLMNPVIRCILRLSFYQLLYMDKVPESAVCNEAVELAKLHGLSGFSGLVNGVLRAAVRDLHAGAPRLLMVGDAATALSVPKWLYQKLCTDLGAETAEQVAGAWLCERPAVLRLNRSLLSEEEAEALLSEDGASFTKLPSETFFAGCGISCAPFPVFYALHGQSSPAQLAAFRKGFLQPQDMSSAIPALLAAPKPGDYIIDVCAAPGGKSLMLADLLQGSGMVEARDLSAQKVALIEENIRRCGFKNIRARVQDALSEDEDSLFRADIVIADLPCSGLGIAARKPDIKMNLKPYSFSELRELQRDILRVASRYVKPRGKLVYSTCTLTPEENAENAAFAAAELGFTLQKEVRVLPDAMHDGFYAALLVRNY